MNEELKQLCSLSKNIDILYVEDDHDLRNKTEAMLNNIFHNVVTATNGKEGFDEYNKYFRETNKYFDIVITDIKMPIMDGITLAKRIKIKNKQQIFVVTSAHDESKNLIEFINIGILKFIKKPFTLRNIIVTFLEIVSNFQTNNTQMNIFIQDGFNWNQIEKRLYKDGIEVKLTHNEIVILELLLNNKGQIFSNNDFFYIMQEDNFNKDLSLDAMKSIFKRMRKKLPLNLIENIYGQGYRINTNKINNF